MVYISVDSVTLSLSCSLSVLLDRSYQEEHQSIKQIQRKIITQNKNHNQLSTKTKK